MKRLHKAIDNLIVNNDFLTRLYAPIKPHVAVLKLRNMPFKNTSVGSSYAKAKPKQFEDIFKVIPRDTLGKMQPPSGSPYIFNSEICRQEHFALPLYQYWCTRIGQQPELIRKQWEFVYILQGLHERGMIRPGSTGVGFGVGKEPLVSLFAASGCKILATDLSEETGRELGWVQTDQHVGEDYKSLWKPKVCQKTDFDSNVTFRHVDMNHIPDDIEHYDFCWSACAFEHLGSIELGLKFVENSIACLKPGGIAIHTSEFNLSSNENTIDDNPSLVLFRQKDYEELIRRLENDGHKVYPARFDTGDGYVDDFVDIPPYFRKNMHLNLLIGKFVSTSFGIVVQKSKDR